MTRPRALLATTLVLLALAGCSPGRAEPAPSPSATTTQPAPPDPDDPAVVRATGVPLASGAVTLLVAAPDATVTPQDDGSARLSVPDGDARLAAPEGMTVTALSDGSAAVHDATGAFVAGLTPDPWGARLTQLGPDVVRLTAAGATPGPAGVWFTAAAVDSAVWGEAEGGRSLAVTPSAWARVGSLAGREGLWAQVVALAPDADVPGMQAQLECHELGAPDKAVWNLEPWRPAVDALEMIAARCNPR
ncbi:DUF2599 domain-containing protein [Cellulomonas sp. ICMP 17802]|uniref:DUF2599 domain-containing protein n=1 Tax=Cellulomonas sp. ICMP 17802 TaxID=3239199 RepID=UPI00351BC8E6